MRLAVLALSVVFFATVEAAMSPAEIRRDYGDAVVTITTYSAADDAVGLGSGFIVDPSGVIVTCYHVINGAYPAVVKLLNGASFRDISVLGCDSAKDVAVIKVRGRNLPAVGLADADGDDVGERVVAIGNPRGLENTISDGLLSGVREMDGYELLQISAPISPGSSGGPVFSSSGQVIGIASAFLKESQNLNFCVPIRYAKPLIVCSTGVTLEEFSAGLRPSEIAGSASMGKQLQSAFLRGLVAPLRSYWELEFSARRDKYRSGTGDPNYTDMLMLFAALREEADEALRGFANLRAPNARLGRILQRYAEIALQRRDAYDAILGATRTKDRTDLAIGFAKLKNSDETGRQSKDLLIGDLSSEYLLDAGVSLSDFGRRLPPIFDSLPAVLVHGVVDVVRERELSSEHAALPAVTDSRELGFRYYQDVPGVVVDSVFFGSPVQRAGLLRDDVIVGADDTISFGSIWDYEMFRASQTLGASFTLIITRDDRTLRLPVSSVVR
jgi:S1-C subfamily serine protease